MPQDAYIVGRLVISVDGASREPVPGSGTNRLSLSLSIKNPVGSPGSTERPPNMEVADESGQYYTAENADWAVPILPDTEVQVPVQFSVPADASRLKLVFAPGEPEEVEVDLMGEGPTP